MCIFSKVNFRLISANFSETKKISSGTSRNSWTRARPFCFYSLCHAVPSSSKSSPSVSSFFCLSSFLASFADDPGFRARFAPLSNTTRSISAYPPVPLLCLKLPAPLRGLCVSSSLGPLLPQALQSLLQEGLNDKRRGSRGESHMPRLLTPSAHSRSSKRLAVSKTAREAREEVNQTRGPHVARRLGASSPGDPLFF